ncbi:phosphoribosyltransferase family protein [soil metagenome]
MAALLRDDTCRICGDGYIGDRTFAQLTHVLFMNYRNMAQLSDAIWSWSASLPADIDLIVGIPRSGLLAANLVALYRNLPLTDLEGFIEGRSITTGRRFARDRLADSAKPWKVLVVDDSVQTGGAMAEAKSRIAAANLPHDILYGAVYVGPGSDRHVDLFAETVPLPRMFEWNFLHLKRNARVCMSIDGILCYDPPVGAHKNAAHYKELLVCAKPLHIPTKKVGWLVTCRAEKYRQLTEEWLARQGVEYGELIMVDLPEKNAHRAPGSSSAFKAQVYRRTGASLFYESSLFQAVQIANIALKPVFCVDTRQMIYPGSVPQDRHSVPPPWKVGYANKIARRVNKMLNRVKRPSISRA